MMKAKQICKKAILAVCLLIALFGCSKKLDRYADPPWLGGTSIATLQKGGNYTIFLQLMDKAGYTNAVTKQLSTLFVPDDDAFRKYFLKRGINSINDLTNDQALEIFTLHFLPNPINANHLVYEKEWSFLESPTGEYRSLFFRKITQSISAAYIEIPRYDKTFKGQQLFMYTGAKFLPLFSNLYFQDYNGTGSIDYPFMYPNSKWGGLMQWHNALILPPKGKENTTNIEDLANPTSSGFIYYLDQVVDAMPSIEQYLIAHNDSVDPNSYGKFYNLMQRYATYTSAGLSDKQGRKLYTKGYSNISNIAAEKGPNVSSTQAPAYQLDIFTLFLPTNDVLQTYLNNTVLKTYSSIYEVPDVTIRYILQSQISNRLELKSKFTPPRIFYNVYGDKSLLDVSQISPDTMCSNGVIYKSTKILEPNIFICVPGLLFFDKNYSVFLNMLSSAGMIAPLSGDNDVTLFAPTNDQLLAANVRLFLTSTGTQEFQQIADDGQWKTMPAADIATYAQDHIYNGKLSDLSGDGYIEMLSHNFVHFSSKTLSAGLNIHLNNVATIVDNKDRKNGILYYIDQPIQTKYRIGQYIMSDPDLSEFAKLLVKTQLLEVAYKEIDTKTNNIYPNIKITEAANAYFWTVFAPNNTAISAGIANGSVPDTTATDLTALKSFVNYHFVQRTIFDDGVVSGSINTLLDGSSLIITNNKNNLKITDATGQDILLNHADADHVVRRGVVHKITSVLKYK